MHLFLALLAALTIILMAQPHGVRADASTTPVPDRSPEHESFTAPAIVQNDGSALRRTLLARLEFEELNLQLIGVARFQSEMMCFIKQPSSPEHMIYKVGNVVGGFRIMEIKGNVVTFERDGIQFWLTLGENSDGRQSESIPPELQVAEEEEVDVNDDAMAVEVASAVEIASEEQAIVVDDREPTLKDRILGVFKRANQGIKIKTRSYESAKVVEDGAKFESAQRSAGMLANKMFAKPIDGRLTSTFGYRRNPFGGGQRFHRGVDLAAFNGSPVKAAAAGAVAKIGYSYTLGRYVILRHSRGYETVYAHLARYLVKTDQQVDQGEVIGQEGSTGRSTGPHLHFEVRKNGISVDPVKYLPLD